MEVVAKWITNRLLRADLLEDEQTEWCKYVIETRLQNISGFLLMVTFGTLIERWEWVLILNLGIMFLKKRTNGLHMPNEAACLLVSLVCELCALSLLPHFQIRSAIIAFLFAIGPIFLFAPCNNDAVHFDEHEMKQLRRSVCRRLSLYIIIVVILLILIPQFSYPLIMAADVVALFVIFARLEAVMKRS